MDTASSAESVSNYWSEESSNRPDRARVRARIGGLHCSLCTGTIEKALRKRPGVDKVAVLEQPELIDTVGEEEAVMMRLGRFRGGLI